jgi:DNA polymerase-3 subunit delta
LVVVWKVPPFAKEGGEAGGSSPRRGFACVLEALHPQVVLLFVDPKPDRRISFVKELFGVATVREFPLLRGEQLRKWVHATLEGMGASIGEGALDLLLEISGEDQQVLSQEIAKLALFARGRPIEPQDVENLVLPAAEYTVWKIVDLLGEGRAEDAVRYAHRIIRRGENPQALWGRMLWMVVSLVQVVVAIEGGAASPDAIVRATGVNFGTVRSLLPLARKCRSASLRGMVSRVADMDLALKTGAYRATAEAEEELEALIDRCLLSFTECG